MSKDDTQELNDIEQAVDEIFAIHEPKEIHALKIDIENLQYLANFASTPVGKQIISERERQVPILCNKLFAQLKDPNLTQIISIIVQLKHAMRDLVDFKGAGSAIEEKQIIIDSLTKKRTE